MLNTKTGARFPLTNTDNSVVPKIKIKSQKHGFLLRGMLQVINIMLTF